MATGRVINGVFVAFTAEEQAAWDATQPSAATLLAEAQVTAVAAIKREAQRRIYSRLPDWLQSNLQARELELVAIAQGLHPTIAQRALTAEEQAERTSAAAEWAWAKSVRAASNSIEADIPATTAAAVFAWLSTMPADERWPA